jgi:hypothetical protein
MPINGDGYVRLDGKLLIPTVIRGLIKRLMVVAHYGVHGHRGSDAMMDAIGQRFAIFSSVMLLGIPKMRWCSKTS